MTCALLALCLALWGWNVARAQGTNQAGLVIQYGDGSIESYCVAFSENQISGQQLLERSGLDIEILVNSGLGAAVCRIEADGCPASNCFCQSPPDYWSYWHLSDGDWVYSQIGVSGWMVTPGSVDGWAWGPGNPPPVVSFDEICTPTTATPTDTSTPTETPSPTLTPIPDTATSQPTASFTPTPTDTPAPSSTNEHTPTAIDQPGETSEQHPSDTPVPTGTTPLSPSPSSTHTPLLTETASPSSTPSSTLSPLPSDTVHPDQIFLQPKPEEASATALPTTTVSPMVLPSQTPPSSADANSLDSASTTNWRSILVLILSYGAFCIFVILLVGGIILTYFLFIRTKE